MEILNTLKFCPCCANNQEFTCQYTYEEKPIGETDFGFSDYNRKIWRCEICGHFLSICSMDLSSLYKADYVDMTYGGIKGIKDKYDKIMNLNATDSDNLQRVDYVINYANMHFVDLDDLSLLDIGSGLGVFLGKIKEKTKWSCVAIEPDKRFADHVKNELAIEAIDQDYRDINWDRKFDIITLNKVLEHIEHPVNLLESCKRDLTSNGFIYIELPDGDQAFLDSDNYNREEFFIEHHHIFTVPSMVLLIQRAGFKVMSISRIKEPSSKYTLRAIAVAN
ncbi:MAG: methyltransferase [Rhodopirellula sp.]|nr:methyltransferase [Rhodopirellula sp.]